jgi:membrane protease YdiL (CAAX protease family)
LTEELKTSRTCDECLTTVNDEQKYCHNCGSYLSSEVVSVSIFNNTDLRQIFMFYFVYLFVCLFVKNSPWFNTYDELFWVEIILAAITLRFVYLSRNAIKPVLTFNNFKWSVLLSVIAIAAVGSLVVSISVQQLNVTFFHNEVNYYKAFKLYTFPTLIMLYSIALMPAIFEELAFRGVMYNYCTAFLDERLVVVVTAFLFAIMHLSMISLAWLIPFGIFIGNLRRKYHTLWYGIIFHFVFNFVACLFDLYRQGELF